MKTERSRIPTILAAFAIALLGIWLLRPRGAKQDGAQDSVLDQVIESSSNKPAITAKPLSRDGINLSPISAPEPNEDVVEQAKAIKLQAAFATKNVPIEFFGKVVDQENRPLSGVRVVSRIRQWNFTTNAGPSSSSLKSEVVTDLEGNFDLTGASGDSLELESVKKEGYRLSPKAQLSFSYGRDADSSQPAAANRSVISMWKLMTSENLISFRTPFGFIPDGRSYTIDLLENKKFEGEKVGDLLVKFTRPLKVEPRQKFDWLLELQGIDGGLIAVEDEFGYLAPETGYQHNLKIEMLASDASWADTVIKDFFIRSRGGQVHGLLHLRIRPEYDTQGAIFFETRVNPARSRNLQPQ